MLAVKRCLVFFLTQYRQCSVSPRSVWSSTAQSPQPSYWKSIFLCFDVIITIRKPIDEEQVSRVALHPTFTRMAFPRSDIGAVCAVQYVPAGWGRKTTRWSGAPTLCTCDFQQEIIKRQIPSGWCCSFSLFFLRHFVDLLLRNLQRGHLSHRWRRHQGQKEVQKCCFSGHGRPPENIEAKNLRKTLWVEEHLSKFANDDLLRRLSPFSRDDCDCGL